MAIHFVKEIKSNQNQRGKMLKDTPLKALKLSDIRCDRGWLHNQLELVSQGITGRLPEYSPFFIMKTTCISIRMPILSVRKLLIGFGQCILSLTGDEKVQKLADEYLEILLNSVMEDGWFGAKRLKNAEQTEDGQEIPELLPNAFILDGLTFCYEHTQDERILKLMHDYIRYCLKLPDAVFLPKLTNIRRFQKIEGGEMLRPLYWYYRKTGMRRH